MIIDCAAGESKMTIAIDYAVEGVSSSTSSSTLSSSSGDSIHIYCGRSLLSSISNITISSSNQVCCRRSLSGDDNRVCCRRSQPTIVLEYAIEQAE